MITRLIFICTLVIGFSCSDEDRSKDLSAVKQEEQESIVSQDSSFQVCDSLYVATFHGTACCVSGPIVASPGDVFKYHYQINHSDARIKWQILEGDISIITGQDTHTVTVLFGPDFTTGIVYADGNGIPRDVASRQRCTDRVIVVKDR